MQHCGNTVFLAKMRAVKKFLTVNDRGSFTLPAAIRREYHLDKPGTQLEIVQRAGVIELHPHVAVPTHQAWYWTPDWQSGEQAVDAHVAAGRIMVADNIDDFAAAMNKGRKKKRARR
jgi:hypothetical protein